MLTLLFSKFITRQTRLIQKTQQNSDETDFKHAVGAIIAGILFPIVGYFVYMSALEKIIERDLKKELNIGPISSEQVTRGDEVGGGGKKIQNKNNVQQVGKLK